MRPSRRRTPAGTSAAASRWLRRKYASRETGKVIGQKISVINESLAKILGSNERVTEREAEAVKDSEARISSVLESFGGMTSRLLGSAEDLRRESEVIKDEIMESMVQLQFQDRVGQILAHVVGSIGELHELMRADGGVSADGGAAAQYLGQMAQSYTTERLIGQGHFGEVA